MKMTYRKAFEILAEASIRDLVGSGCGYHSIPSPKVGCEVVEAIRFIGKKAWGTEYQDYRVPGFQSISGEYLDTPAPAPGEEQ